MEINITAKFGGLVGKNILNQLESKPDKEIRNYIEKMMTNESQDDDRTIDLIDIEIIRQETK